MNSIGAAERSALFGSEPPLLEEWYRSHLHQAEIDISSSGVSPYTVSELAELTGFEMSALNNVLIDDSESFGAQGLRKAIANRYAGGRTDRVMATHGSSEAIFLVLSALVTPGTKVAHVDPIYHALTSTPRRIGAHMVPVPLDLFVGREPRWAEIEDLVGDDTDVIIVNFPHNPTGVSLEPDGVRRLVEIARGCGAVLIWDAAFEHLTTAPEVPGDLGTLYADSVVFGTTSKAYGLPGLRVGWAIAPPWILQRTLALHDSTTLFLSPIVEEMARAAVETAPTLVRPRLERSQRNLAHLRSWIESDERANWVEPDGGVCCFVEFPGMQDSSAFCRALLERHQVILVPGAAFGRDDGVRLGFGGPEEEFRIGIERLRAFLDEGPTVTAGPSIPGFERR